MNRDIWEGKWRQIKGMMRARWGKLTRDDLDIVYSDQQVLVGRVQERYGCALEEAERQVQEFMRDREKVRNLRSGERVSFPGMVSVHGRAW